MLCYLLEIIVPFHKSHNAPVPYPTQYTTVKQKCAHFCSIVVYRGYGTGALWDLWDWAIDFVEILQGCLSSAGMILWVCQCQLCHAKEKRSIKTSMNDLRQQNKAKQNCVHQFMSYAEAKTITGHHHLTCTMTIYCLYAGILTHYIMTKLA